MKSFDQVKKMLEEKNLLLSSMQRGESYGIDSFRTMRCEGDFQHKLLVLRHDTEFLEDSISYMAQPGTLSPAVTKLIIARSYSSAPFQMFIVNDIDAAEKAVKEFLS